MNLANGPGRAATQRLDPGLVLDSVSVSFGGIRAVDAVSFNVAPGQICGLIGPNGAGKTTVFNVLTRIYEPTAGSVTYGGRDLLELAPHRVVGLGIARTFQNLALFAGLTAVENVLIGTHRFSSTGWLRTACRLGLRRDEAALRERAMEALDTVGIVDIADHSIGELPFGTLKRVEIARAIAAGPTMLLLDEPANGLTHGEVDELADVILSIRQRAGLSVLLIEHHMGIVSKICERVVVLDFGRKIAEGTPLEVASDPLVVSAYLGAPA